MEVQTPVTQELKFTSTASTSAVSIGPPINNPAAVQSVAKAGTSQETETSPITLSPPPVFNLAVTRESVITQQSSGQAVTAANIHVVTSPQQPTTRPQPLSTTSTITTPSTKDSLSKEAIEMIETEFVKLKAEQLRKAVTNQQQPETVVISGGGSDGVTRTVVLTTISGLTNLSPAVTVAAGVGGEGGQLVYCNLNDLDLQGGDGGESAAEQGYNLTSLASLAEASQTLQHQEKGGYPGVQTLLLQGGVLQLKGEGSGLMTAGTDEPEQVLMTVAGHPEGAGKMMTVAGHSGVEKMINIPHSQQVQVVSLNQNGQARVHTSQDAIASILASMNSQQMETERGVEEELEENVYEETKPEPLPLNLATTASEQGVIQGQPIQLQGIKRVITQPSFQQLSTKKVIIATINGTQRILTPVSTPPQFITMKSAVSPRSGSVFIDQNGDIVNSSSPILLKQPSSAAVSVGQLVSKTKPLPPGVIQSPGGGAPVGGPRNADNKTCMWKFENGQICGKVFTKTYNLTVHMRMHQDIRPFPCGVCEQTFRQKAHLQRHEATHGIDSTASRKKRKRPGSTDEYTAVVSPGGTVGLSSVTPLRSEDPDDPLSADDGCSSPKNIKTELSGDVDAIVEAVQTQQQRLHFNSQSQQTTTHIPPPPVKKSVSNVNVGTNTDLPMLADDNGDEMKDGTLVLRRLREPPVVKGVVEQGVQYCEEDLIVPDSLTKREMMDVEVAEENEEELYSSHQYVTDLGDGHFQTADGQFIDTSSNQIVMSSDGELVGFVPVEAGTGGVTTIEQQAQHASPVVNISTTTNEQGQQVVIIENLHHHSQELQKEIINALMAENNLIQLPN